MGELPEHLGGEVNGNVDTGLVSTLVKELGINSMVDIGCGSGAATEQYRHFVPNIVGIDGDWTRLPKGPHYMLHDFTKGPLAVPADLAYSVEFVEHVEERFVDNFMPAFAACRYAVITAAQPDQPGHHHVNCRPKQYWIDLFKSYGLEYDHEYTEYLKKRSTMRNAKRKTDRSIRFFKTNGMFFRRR